MLKVFKKFFVKVIIEQNNKKIDQSLNQIFNQSSEIEISKKIIFHYINIEKTLHLLIPEIILEYNIIYIKIKKTL